MTKLDDPMTAETFKADLAKLGLSVYASAKVLGVSLRQVQRYAAAEEPVPMRVSRSLRFLQMHVDELKATHEQLRRQVELLASGRSRMYWGKKDVTGETLSNVQRQLKNNERLLTYHPAGLRPQLPDIIAEVDIRCTSHKCRLVCIPQPDEDAEDIVVCPECGAGNTYTHAVVEGGSLIGGFRAPGQVRQILRRANYFKDAG